MPNTVLPGSVVDVCCLVHHFVHHSIKMYIVFYIQDFFIVC